MVLNADRISEPDSKENLVARSFFNCLPRILAAAGASTVLFAVASQPAMGQEADSVPAGAIAGDLYQFPPTTLSELADAARITQKLDRADDARAFLKQILNSQPSEEELRALKQQVGITLFIELRRDPRLLPESEQLLKAVNSANLSAPLPAGELQALVQSLGQQGIVAVRAATELIASGDDALPALLAADVNTPSGRVADKILQEHARDLRGGLLTQLDSSDDSARVRILKLLSGTADREMAIRLLRWQFDPKSDELVSMAARDAISRLSRSELRAETVSEATKILIDEAEKLIRTASERFPASGQSTAVDKLSGRQPRTESLNNARTMLADALRLDPQNETANILTNVVNCEATSPQLTAEASVAAKLSSQELWNGLAVALELRTPIAAIEFLRGIRAAVTEPSDYEKAGAILRHAMISPDARIRHMAADLVRRKWPSEARAGSVLQTVLSARKGSVKPEVVIVDNDVRQARDLQTVLKSANYSPETAETAAEGFELAVSQMNCELFILNAESPGWTLPMTLANLRADARTRNTPIVVIGPQRFASRMAALGEIYPGTWFVPEPVGKDSLNIHLEMLNLPGIVLTPADRAVLKKLAE